MSKQLGEKQLLWLRRNLLHNGVRIFDVCEKTKTTRAKEAAQ